MKTKILSEFYFTVIYFRAMIDDSHDNWNKLQKELSNMTEPIFCNRREIWWCSIGMNIGTELYGKNELFERPVLIMKVYNKETALIVPLTSKIKFGKYYSDVVFGNVTSRAVLSQARTVSTKRLSRKLGRISKENFIEVKQKYIKSL